MDKLKVLYEPEAELPTVFWQDPQPNQIAFELDEDIVLLKDETTSVAIGIELLGFVPGDDCLQNLSGLGLQGLGDCKVMSAHPTLGLSPLPPPPSPDSSTRCAPTRIPAVP